MKKSIYFLLLFILPLSIIAQVVTTDPVFPIQTGMVTITFDAAQGNGELEGVSPPIYAHTGVITSASTSPSDWQHVQGNWGTADANVLMTSIGNDKYQMTYNINSFYGVNAGEVVEQLAFVFRNQDGSKVGRATNGDDIFVDVYPAGGDLLTLLLAPENSDLIVPMGNTIEVEGAASVSSTLSLYEDGTLLTQTTGTNLTYTITASVEGNHTVDFIADDGTNQSMKSFNYVVPQMVNQQDPPAGTQPGINYISDTKVRLSLYAPNKGVIYVIGDFNDWQLDDAYQMNQSLDGKTWWLDIDGLTAGDIYGFQYLVDGTLKIADPYSELVLDPGNDGGIPNNTYPNLHPYPNGQTSGIVTLIQPGKAPYDWQVNDFQKPAKEELVIYELMMRDFTAARNYQTLIDTLDYLERLGINAIELMPINEFEGNESWGYNPSFHMALDKYYGTIDKFKEFVDEAHARGIAVILDVVYNHAFSQSPLCQLYWDAGAFKPSPDNPWLNPDAKHPFNVGYDFNHESDATKVFVKRVMEYWLSEMRIDGFRFDLSKGFTQVDYAGNVGAWSAYDASRIAILKDYANSMWATTPDAYVILEHFAANNEETELANYGMMLWGNTNHEYGEASMGYSSNLSGVDYKSRGWNVPHLISYMESHDEERLNYKNLNFGNSGTNYSVTDLPTALKRLELASVFYIPVPGPKMLWQFGEVGYDFSINRCTNGSIDSNCRLSPKPVRWDYYDDPDRRHLYDVTRALLHLRNTYPVFNTNQYILGLSNSFKKRINLQHPDMNVTIIGNFDVEDAAVEPFFQHPGTWYEYFSGDSIEIVGIFDLIDLAAGEYRLYTDVKIENNIVTNPSTSVKYAKKQNFQLELSPNPTDNQFVVNYVLENKGLVRVDIFNLQGQNVGTMLYEEQSSGEYQVELAPNLATGNYFVRLSVDGVIQTKRLIVQH